jgi:hypothetical protein
MFIKYISIRLAILAMVIFALALIFSEDGRPDSYMSGQVGIFNTGKQSISESKFVNVGYRDIWCCGISYQYEAGGWIDRAGNGRKNSGYGAFQMGVEAGDTTIARVMAGPALITTPDSYLGGAFQFTEDFFIGIRGNSRNTVGIKYKHFSSAGLEQPNVGRDYLGAEISIPW